MHMSHDEKRTTLAVSRRRYAELKGKTDKGRFLTEFCALTGVHRKHAVRALNATPAHRKRKRGHPKICSMDAVRLLTRLWKLADKPCGKLLKPILKTLVESLRRHEKLDEKAAAELLLLSPATLDRRLRHAKPCATRHRRRADSLAEHRYKIALKIDTWPADAKQTPGWLEADTVAHCGGSLTGSFIWTLTLTDVATGWLEMRPAWNKGGLAVCNAIRDGLAAVPFPVLGFNSDNGPDFLNAHLAREFPTLCPNALRSRSRAYCKNDNPHVEQKNGHAVRGLLGYGRLEREDTQPMLRELLATSSLLRNLYAPTFKLLDKRRDNARWIKRFEKEPKTPAQRVLESAAVSQAAKQRVRDLLCANDFITLRRRVDTLLSKFIALDRLPLAAALPVPAPRRCDELRTAHSRVGGQARAGGSP
jgi:hypothetical protein